MFKAASWKTAWGKVRVSSRAEQSRADESRKGGLWLRGPQGIRRPGLEDLPLKGLRELGPA